MIAQLHFGTRRVSAFTLAGAIGVLAGCSANSQVVSPVRSNGSFVPATFSIQWGSTAASASTRRPQFVSPSAQSVVVRINGDASLSAFANKGSAGVSTIALQAPVGTDTFSVSLYDKTQTSASVPAGKLLGQVTVVQSIAEGKLNAVTAVVNGIVDTVTIDPLPKQPYLETTSAGFAIVGQHSATFAVTPRDADGNAIVPPGITPAVSLSTGAGNSYFAVLPTTDPTQFNVTVVAQAPTGSNASFNATATDAQNAAVTASMSIEQRGEVYVAYGSGRVLAFDDAGNALQLPNGSFSGLQTPVSLAYDPSDRTLFVADSAAGVIRAFDQDGAPISGFTPPSLPGVTAVAWSPIIFQDQILGVSPSTAIIASSFTGGPTGDTSTQSPFTVTSATGAAFLPASQSEPDMYLVSDTSTNALDLYGLYGVPPIFGPSSIALAPVAGVPGQLYASLDGNSVWVTGTVSGSGELWRVPVTPQAPAAVAVADTNGPAGFTYDPQIDRLFIAESLSGTVAAYTTDLTPDPTIVLTAPVSAGVSNPQGVAVAY